MGLPDSQATSSTTLFLLGGGGLVLLRLGWVGTRGQMRGEDLLDQRGNVKLVAVKTA